MRNACVQRRTFLKGGVPSVFLLTAGCSPLSGLCASVSSSKPNIIMIFSDSHRADVLGCYGNSIIRTPNLDRLASEGVLFEDNYCTSPLCGPSRLSFTAGKYASRVNVWNLWYGLPESPSFPTLPRIMNAAGYVSTFCGHMDYPPDDSYGFEKLGNPAGGRRKTLKGRRRDPNDLKPIPGYSDRFKDSHVGNDSHTLRTSRDVTQIGLDFLSRQNADGKPFFLLLGYSAPHFPFTVPEEYYSHYKDRIPMPVIPKGYLDSLPLNYKHLRIAFNCEDVPDHITKVSRELYYGLTEWFDTEVGKVLAAVENSPLASNTVVIYSSDHGENMGDHGLWWKNAMFDTSTRVPLIVSWPDHWKGNQRRKGACSLLDVAQTIADIGGAKVPVDWNGDSLVPWLNDPAYPWKDRAVSEYYAHNIASGYAMIREGDYKYVYHTPADSNHPAERELYDLDSDPNELNNLAVKKEYAQRIRQMHADLIKDVGEDPDKTEQRCRADYQKNDPVKK